MFILETRSKPLRKWSKLMFVFFLLAPGALLTMHMYVKPNEKTGVRTTKTSTMAVPKKDDRPLKMRLNGWQRIGIVASVIWAIAAPIYFDNVAENDARERFYMHYDLCRNNPSNSSDRCAEEADRWRNTVQRYRLFTDTANVAAVSLVPIPLGWLFAYILISLGRWIRAG